MKRVAMAAVAAAGLLVVGHGTHRAVGQMPQCEGKDGAVPGQQYGTAADEAAKKQADAEKFQTADANAATEACRGMTSPAGSAAPTSGSDPASDRSRNTPPEPARDASSGHGR